MQENKLFCVAIYRCKKVNSFTLYPWVHQWCNNRSTDDQTQPITFPDVNPSDLPEGSNFSMAAGDFLEIYKDPGITQHFYKSMNIGVNA